jgi:hypothetical protein
MQTEKKLERDFCDWAKERDIVPVKGPANLAKGIPDRFLQLPRGGGTIYVEFKGTSYYGLSKIQEWWMHYLLDSNPNRYFVIDNVAELEELKQKCLDFIAIGKELVDYETKLLKELHE